jgi:D-alanyl-D-alanine carboxypeptidase/D-alanyl-D-alanine-endopeptidase (penicillin-binding protein 4)
MRKASFFLIAAALGAVPLAAPLDAQRAGHPAGSQPGAQARPVLAREIERAIAESPLARTAAWGIEATDLASGKTVFEWNADHFFVPASNTKLFSTALALTRLGPGFTFTTRVIADAPLDASGVIDGDVRLVGGGDPNLSGRGLPYQPKSVSGDPLGPLGDLAAQMVAAGVKRINGRIIGDDRWYLWEPFAAGWGIDDPLYDYGAPVSALTIDDNAFALRVKPGAKAGEPAALELSPPVEFYTIDNHVRTIGGAGERIHYSRAPGGMTLELWGDIGLESLGETLSLGIDDPARYGAIALRDLLRARGVSVVGTPISEHLFPYETPDRKQGSAAVADAGTVLAKRTSAPLIEDLRVTAKVSQNLHAELDLRAVGKARRNMGSVEAGLEELRAFLTEIGVPASGYNFNDGSGLARPNLVSPATIVTLLKYMYHSPARDNFLSILPVGGQDGTLERRFSGPEIAGRIHAKTGSLSHVSALSGYAQRKGGSWIAFSILVNNYNGSGSDIHAVMDKICELLAGE